MKVIKETKNIIYYLNKYDDEMIAIKLPSNETVMKEQSACDYCNEHDEVYYLSPQLGNYGYCTKCFKEYAKRSSWYTADSQFTYNQLILFILNYNLNYTKEELDIVNAFFSAHSTRRIDIYTFLDKYKGGNN